MTVINILPNQEIYLPANTVPANMHIYCVGPQASNFGISIMHAPPPYVWHNISAGYTLTFQVDNLPVWIFNRGPSKIQALYADEKGFEAQSLENVTNAVAFEGDVNYRYYNARIVGPPPAVCANIIDDSGFYVQSKCDNCFYWIRTTEKIATVRNALEHAADAAGYSSAVIEVNCRKKCT